MNQIEIKPAQIGGALTETVSAKLLHSALGVKTSFLKWIQRRIEECGYSQDVDFRAISKKVQNESWFGPRTITEDYLLTIDMAKELCMLERNDKGRQFRRYFIERERDAIEKGRQLELLATEMLKRNDTWRKIKRYVEMGLNNRETGVLCGLAKSTVRNHRRKMEACGLLTPPPQLAKQQQMSLRLLQGGAA